MTAFRTVIDWSFVRMYMHYAQVTKTLLGHGLYT